MTKCGLITGTGEPVPLKEVSIEVTISGFVAHVQADLHYENKEKEPIEAEFTFPLDDGSAVYKFEAVIEGRHIIAECQEKEEARQTYTDAIESGQTAMLLEEDDSSSDIFSCTVGNLPANTVAKLTLGYVLELPLEPDGKLRFTLPMVLNPRYSPNVGHLIEAKGATRVPLSKIPYTFKFSAAVVGTEAVESVTSDQGKINVKISHDKLSVEVSLNDDFQFDEDVRFLIQYEDCYKPQCVKEAGNRDSTGFLAEDVLMVNFYPDIDSVGQTNRGEYIFILDRSGSMRSSKINNAKEALLLFLKSLPVGCYFNIVSFGSSFELLFPGGSKEYTEASLNEAMTSHSTIEADMGGTEILRPLQDVYSKRVIPGHPRQLFLLTDGEVGNVNEVIAIVKKNADNTRVFSVGIGDGASTSLVNGIARAGKGKAEFIGDNGRIQPKVMSLLKCAMQPSMTNIDIVWELPPGVSAITMPQTPPALFGGERLILYALLQGTEKSNETGISGKVYINGKMDKGPLNCSANFFHNNTVSVGSSLPLHRLAAKAQIKLLQDKENDSNERENVKKDIITLSTSSNIASSHTSFVAIDKDRKEKVEGKSQSRRSVPLPWDPVWTGLPAAASFQYLSDTEPLTKTLYKFSVADSDDTITCNVDPPSINFEVIARTPPGSTLMSRNVGHPPGAPPSSSYSRSYDRMELDETCKKMPGDPMMDMVSLQGFQGNWSLNDTLCQLLGVDMKKLKDSNIVQDDDVLATLVVLLWLRINFQNNHDEWDLIENKALSWLDTRGVAAKEKFSQLSNMFEGDLKIK